MSETVNERRFLKEGGQEGAIAELVEPVIEDLGYRIVRVKISEYRGHILQIMAEKTDGSLEINDCKKISKALSPLLDLSDIINGSYSLEVSSPGIDRPIVRLSEIDKYQGCEVKIELNKPIENRKRFRGFLDGIEEADKLSNNEIGELEIRLLTKLDGSDEEHVIGLKTGLIADVKLILSKYIFKSDAREEETANKPAKKNKKKANKVRKRLKKSKKS